MDWLSNLLTMVPVSGQLELRCHYGAPWRVAYEVSDAGEMPYHVIIGGSAVLDDLDGGPPQHLTAGDILVLPHGGAHVLHDGSGRRPNKANNRDGLNFIISENTGTGARLDMLCGRFILAPPHDRLLLSYLPPRLIVRTAKSDNKATTSGTGAQLTGLMKLMRAEAGSESLGGQAMLNALSAALFALTLRFSGESDEAPTGLLALASQPRLAPALRALFLEPARPWTLPELAELCNMSRATIARHFQERLGRSASNLLTDIRMTIAANELRTSSASVGAVGEAVGYQSEAAFQRAFKQRMGTTPAQWRRAGQSRE
ncbi:AraC family transcriptional activator of mtrCDE [Nitrobacteraceae bacterium AZCC 1564]